MTIDRKTGTRTVFGRPVKTGITACRQVITMEDHEGTHLSRLYASEGECKEPLDRLGTYRGKDGQAAGDKLPDCTSKEHEEKKDSALHLPGILFFSC